jgi:hypothetical protein
LIDKKITWGFLLSATCRSLKQTASGTRLNINTYLPVGVASHFLPINMGLAAGIPENSVTNAKNFWVLYDVE